MDRTIVYPSAIPQDTDILVPQRNIMTAFGFLIQALYGPTTTWTNGLNATPTAPASMSIVIGPGSVIQNSVVDANAFGSLSPDSTDALMKMGINLHSTQLGPFSAPAVAGQSQNFLIQGALSEVDTSPV